jgi:hypothetical protein
VGACGDDLASTPFTRTEVTEETTEGGSLGPVAGLSNALIEWREGFEDEESFEVWRECIYARREAWPAMNGPGCRGDPSRS